nr:SDR family oxidoreductase [Saprospiraceae bacterium]
MITLITGASKGIGNAISHALADKGYDLILNSRTVSELKSLKQEMQTLHPGIEITLLPADLSEEKARNQVLEYLIKKFAQIDLLINNAGIYLPGSMIEEPDDHLTQSIALNLMAPYHLTRGLFPLLKKSSGGQVINICSIASLSAFPNGGAYSISKHAVLGFSRNLREEL